MAMQIHPIPPFFDDGSRLLILGSFPSVKSREMGFFYGHPQNRFWRVLSEIYEGDMAESERLPIVAGSGRSALTRRSGDLPDAVGAVGVLGAAAALIASRKEFLHRHHIALWDVIASCDIEGSSDASIKNVTATDLSVILENAPIEAIFVNGKTAERLYKKYTERRVGRPAVCLPSTSPANAAWSVERLVEVWREKLTKQLH